MYRNHGEKSVDIAKMSSHAQAQDSWPAPPGDRHRLLMGGAAAAWRHEAAFRQELLLAVILVPLAAATWVVVAIERFAAG